MKKIMTIAFAFLLIGLNGLFAQETPRILTLNPDKSYSFDKVYDVQGKNQDEIFEIIKHWVIKNSKSQSNTNYFDEKGKNNITTTLAFPCSYNSTVDFKLNVGIKDGKYRLSATSFIWHNMQGISKSLGDYSGIAANKKTRTKILNDVENGFEKIINSIQGSFAGNSDW